MFISNYPTKKVVFAYTLIGGAIGGTLIALWLISIIIAFDSDFLELAKDFIIWILMGAVIGFLPALITSVIISLKRIRLLHLRNYLQISLIGYVTTFPLLVLIDVLMINWLNELTGYHLKLNDLIWCLEFSLVGAISSVIVGKIFLPKT